MCHVPLDRRKSGLATHFLPSRYIAHRPVSLTLKYSTYRQLHSPIPNVKPIILTDDIACLSAVQQ